MNTVKSEGKKTIDLNEAFARVSALVNQNGCALDVEDFMVSWNPSMEQHGIKVRVEFVINPKP